MDIFLTEIQIYEITSFSKTELFEKIETGDFPKPVEIDRANRWLESEIHQWLNSKNLHISR
jgi:predicted DNA-binding transcriptional regulator AlpA